MLSAATKVFIRLNKTTVRALRIQNILNLNSRMLVEMLHWAMPANVCRPQTTSESTKEQYANRSMHPDANPQKSSAGGHDIFPEKTEGINSQCEIGFISWASLGIPK
jgi:hypothetical protein